MSKLSCIFFVLCFANVVFGQLDCSFKVSSCSLEFGKCFTVNSGTVDPISTFKQACECYPKYSKCLSDAGCGSVAGQLEGSFNDLNCEKLNCYTCSYEFAQCYQNVLSIPDLSSTLEGYSDILTLAETMIDISPKRSVEDANSIQKRSIENIQESFDVSEGDAIQAACDCQKHYFDCVKDSDCRDTKGASQLEDQQCNLYGAVCSLDGCPDVTEVAASSVIEIIQQDKAQFAQTILGRIRSNYTDLDDLDFGEIRAAQRIIEFTATYGTAASLDTIARELRRNFAEVFNMAQADITVTFSAGSSKRGVMSSNSGEIEVSSGSSSGSDAGGYAALLVLVAVASTFF